MISEKEYLKRKVDTHTMYESDVWYMEFANKLFSLWRSSGVYASLSEECVKEICLCITSYLQDISGDIGLWRAFIGECRKLYGSPVPFYTDSLQEEIDDSGHPESDYVDFELNKADVRFLVWYSINFYSLERPQFIYPFNSELIALADLFHTELEKNYDLSPVPEGMVKTNDLDLYDADDAEEIGKLAHWMYWNSYLLVPAFKTNMVAVFESLKGKTEQEQAKEIDETQMTVPTGPLALFLGEWIWLLVRGEMPKQRNKDKKSEHPYYKGFLQANDGREIAFFDSYKALNQFFADALGWNAEEDNLPALKQCENFTLLVNKEKGMLIARDVAQCLYAENNPYYDSEKAFTQSFELLTERGKCPIDLVLYAIKHNMLPDLKWRNEGEESHQLTIHNADFIARCYLLQYYRAV